ncbi:MAG: dipicolinate synthase subunit DpsA [Halanaerobiaceae bacterium]|nr:dipicolinate synthase subunit DpsA [Halanaerobiaceae bacterium]
MNNIAVIGGDKREEVLIRILLEKGFKVSVLSENNLGIDELFYTDDHALLLQNADVVIAPVSGLDDNLFLKSRFINNNIQLNSSFFDLMKKDALFLIGVVTEKLKKLLEEKSISFVELASLDSFAIKNAVPTAEGAIKIAIEETGFTIHNSKVIIYGLGRIGIPLAWRLKVLGADTYAVTRSKEAAARGMDLGIKMITYNLLDDYLPAMDIIFNTVPCKIITEESLSLVKKSAVIIDLASYPGGVDFESAGRMGIKAIHAPGLPGKLAPVTAGKILADTIIEILE